LKEELLEKYFEEIDEIGKKLNTFIKTTNKPAIY